MEPSSKGINFYTILLTFILLGISESYSQQDTISYLWPIAPMTTQREIGGTFGEYRSTSVNGHFHNGTDVGAAAGTPVLAVLAGTVAYAYDDGNTGYDSYVRVTSIIDGKSKNLTYYHTRPVVSVGQHVDVGQQISTIAIDHVHIIDYRWGAYNLANAQLNALRPDGGIISYKDTWKPHIRYVKFFLDNSNTELDPNSIGSKVDIISHVQEVNGLASSSQNNGTYILGYKILSADKQTVVYNPPDDGVRYTYYNLPSNSYVNVNYYQPLSNTSTHVYIVTNGTGSSDVAKTQVVKNNYWDADAYPYGKYVVMVFTKDTRGNADTVYIPITTKQLDLQAPEAPKLLSIKNDSSSYFSLKWKTSSAPDLKGYRSYYSVNGTGFQIRSNESILTPDLTSFQYSYSQKNPLFLRLTAVDTANLTNESLQSDTYGIRMLDDNNNILIVDGFARYKQTGDWKYPYNNFVVPHAQSFNLSFESCSNSEIDSGYFNLNDYNMVIWILGDASVDDTTLTYQEQNLIKSYLENGGKLFVSGSNIAWDLEGAPSANDTTKAFLHDYLKAKFSKNTSSFRVINGNDSTYFNNLVFNFGLTYANSPYNVTSPDEIEAYGGSQTILRYNDQNTAGIQYSGKFGSSSKEGQIVYLAVPFESIGDATVRKNIMNDALTYFGLVEPSAVKDENITPGKFELAQNYPNPFNPSTKIRFSIPEAGFVKLKIYDMLGRELQILLNHKMDSGVHEINFNASNLSSGVYLYRVDVFDNSGKNITMYSSTKKMILLK